MAPSDSPTPTFVTLARAAEHYSVHPDTLRRFIAQGRIRAYRFGSRLVRVRLGDVEAALRPIGGGTDGDAA